MRTTFELKIEYETQIDGVSGNFMGSKSVFYPDDLEIIESVISLIVKTAKKRGATITFGWYDVDKWSDISLSRIIHNFDGWNLVVWPDAEKGLYNVDEYDFTPSRREIRRVLNDALKRWKEATAESA